MIFLSFLAYEPKIIPYSLKKNYDNKLAENSVRAFRQNILTLDLW